jgi:predicted ribonuclease YlaK
MRSGTIVVEALSYIRGRSIAHQYMVIDEAQNLTPLETKTIVTRVGTGTKVVFTGDPYQIDNPYVDSSSNGFNYLVSRFRDQEPVAAHIELQTGRAVRVGRIGRQHPLTLRQVRRRARPPTPVARHPSLSTLGIPSAFS